MHLRCPHCQNPIEVADVPSAGEITCAGCGSSFQVANFTTVTWQGPVTKRIGKFEVIATVGHGAFGTVLKAHDTELDRIVAIKVPRASNVGSDPHDVDRFLREARSVAQLRFPSIISIHEIGIDSGAPYLVCDFVEGVTLADRLTGHRFSFMESAKLLADVADALEYAHGLGVVHRDVKPSNIMIRPDGSPCVMDFGLAKREAGEITMTIDGQILGTPAYMSPEQARGESHRVDGRSDVYSLGVILYQLLTGELPFRGNKSMLLHQVLHEEPRSLRTLNDKIPRDLETIALKALAKEPTRRYASARELADELRRWLAGEPILARPVGRGEKALRWCKRNPALAAASGLAVAALLAVAVVSTWAAFAQHDAAAQIRREMDRTEDALTKVSAEKIKTEEALQKSKRLAATLALDQGLALCEQGEVGHGMLWLARSLEIAPADAADLQRVIRANLGAWRHRLQPLKAVLSHPSAVETAEFSPDGKIVATSCEDRKARLWDAVTGEQLGAAMDHDGAINILIFTRDSQTLVTACSDKNVRFWNARTGAPLGKIVQHYWPYRMALSPDEKLLAVGDIEGVARFYDFKTHETVGNLMQHPERVTQIGFSPDGKTMMTATWPGTVVRFWEVPTGKPLGELRHKTGVVKAFALSADGKRLATAGSDGLAMLWDAQTREALPPTFPHLKEVTALTFSPDGKTLLTASADQAARLWNVSTGKPLGRPIVHRSDVWRFAFSHDGKTVVTAGFEGTARWCDASDGQPLAAAMQHQAPIIAVAFSPDDQTILTGGLDGRVQLWGQAGPSHLLHVLPCDGRVNSAALDRAGKIVLTGDWGGSGKLWDVATGKQLGPSLRNLRYLNRVHAVALSPDGKTAVTSSQRWDVATAELIGTPLVHDGPVNVVAFSPDGKRILTGISFGEGNLSKGVGGKGQLWDASSGDPVGLVQLHAAPVYAVVFSPDGSKYLTAGGNAVQGELHLCETATGKLIGRPIQHHALIEQAVFSSDGRLLATSSYDRTARLWDAATGEPVGQVMIHQSGVNCVAFSPDSKMLVTGCSDRLARFWDIRGNPIGAPLPHADTIVGAAFSPDGQALVTGCDNGDARLWDVATAKPIGPRGQHLNSIHAIAFCPDGKAWLTASSDTTAKLWKVPEPWTDDVERINLWLQCTTGLELDHGSGSVLAIDAAAWRDRLRRLHKNGDQ